MKRIAALFLLIAAVLVTLYGVTFAAGAAGGKKTIDDADIRIDNEWTLTDDEITRVKEIVKNELLPGSHSGGFEILDECQRSGHKLKSVFVTYTEHNAFRADPRCSENRYRINLCTRSGCGFYEEYFMSLMRVSCHTGSDEVEWERYDSYLYYDNRDGHKTEGYVVDRVKIYFDRGFDPDPDSKEYKQFAELNDIESMDYDEATNTSVARIKTGYSQGLRNYNENIINNFILYIRFLEKQLSVVAVEPVYLTNVHVSNAEETGEDTEAEVPPADGAETNVQEAENTVAKPSETEASGESDEIPLKNPQTADPLTLYVLICSAAVLLLVAAAKLIYSKRQRFNKL